MKKLMFLFLIPFVLFANFDMPVQEEEETVSCDFIFDSYTPRYLPSSVHQVVAVSVLGDSLELEDGSVWKVNPYDANRILCWHAGDLLVVTQNHRWFSSSKYRIVHHATKMTVEASLFRGPVEGGFYTQYVAAIDPVNGQVILVSGNGEQSRWDVCASDQAKFHKWLIGDGIIIGQNSGWGTSCEGILINVNLDAFIRAKQY